MTELEKCMAGKDYNCHDKIFLDFKSHARKLLQEYSNADILEKENPNHVFYCVNDLYEYFNRK